MGQVFDSLIHKIKSGVTIVIVVLLLGVIFNPLPVYFCPGCALHSFISGWNMAK